MKILLLLIFSAVFLFSNTIFAQNSDLKSEFQSWNEVQFSVPSARGKDAKGKSFDEITATFNGILRVGRKNLDFLDNRVGAIVDFRVNKFASVTTSVLYRKDELTVNRRRFETRLDVGAIFLKTWRGFVFRDRNLFEHRFRNSRNDLNLYRQRIQVSYPLKFNKKELFAPFISEEGYRDLQLKNGFKTSFTPE